jgi:SAM-dependent methyltransferase
MTASAGNPLPSSRLRDGKTDAIARVIKSHLLKPPKRILVVGCGSGIEAAVLADEFEAHTTGIDLDGTFDPIAARRASLLVQDATNLDFPDKSFDLVFSYHALEHIPRYDVVLNEMRRVLTEDGHYCVGTPNRLRLIGYIGSKDASLRQKLMWNASDWSARIRGRFRNEFGAHAGFSPLELQDALKVVFSTANDVTFEYYLAVYSNKATLIRLLQASGFGRFLFPSVYFVGQR